MGRLQLLQAPEQPVELQVADDRLVKHVVAVVVLVDLAREALDLGPSGLGRHGGFLSWL
ncbi:hypothetical protein D3C72_2523240 [compost metagenome]